MDIPYYRQYSLPWSISLEEERLFRKLLLRLLIAGLALIIIWPWLPTSKPDPFDIEELPPRYAELILEKKTPPPPPPPTPEEVEPEATAAEPVPVPEEVAPEPEPEPIAEEPEPEPDARETASRAGLMAFSDDLAALRDNSVLDSVKGDKDLTGTVGAGERTERSLITSNVAGGSGGINTASLSRNTGGGGLSGRSTTRVASPVAGVGGGGSGKSNVRRSGSSGKASRSQEEIELVFDRNKGAIYRLYNRALRNDPTLQGKLVLRLTISPRGQVTLCEVLSSELNDAELERKLVQRVKLFKFEAKDVEAITTTKPIDFFPA